MPSLEESRRLVKAGLENELANEDILGTLKSEIDKHNAAKEDLRRTMHRSKRSQRDDVEKERRSTRFRFKSELSDPRKDAHRSKNRRGGERGHHKRRKLNHDTKSPEGDESAHPFPREPADPDATNTTDAFRNSLFDALADDEGAQYWESIYSQPVHIYPRPAVETVNGQLEQMSDDEYVNYVKRRMWERKHPEEMLERERSQRLKREEDEKREKRRESFVRKKEREAWTRAARNGARKFAAEDEEYEPHVPKDWHIHDGDTVDSTHTVRPSDCDAAWSRYLADWNKLEHELLGERDAAPSEASSTAEPSKRIPWPTLSPTKPVTKPNIEAFMCYAPADGPRSRLQLLKAERVRWHPDKVRQRFGGKVDGDTVQLVTGVFQVIDALFEEEKSRVI